MGRAHAEEVNGLGHNSFLDVVTNMVGILIILVMVLGTRMKNAPVTLAPDQEFAAAQADLQNDEAIEQTLRADVVRLAEEIAVVRQSAQARFAERETLSTLVAACEQNIEERRKALGAEARQEFDQDRRVNESQAELARLEQDQIRAASAEAEPVEVKSYPTPISKPVDGDEFHFQLRGRRITFVPMEDLVQQFRADAQQKAYRLRDESEITETIGPVGAFRIRYTLERREITIEDRRTERRAGSVIRLVHFELIPISADLGEPLEAALAPESEFRQVLARARRGRSTVTLWTYPDSFAEFRRLKEELYRLGLLCAGRPLPDNILIGGSPEGTKSNAE